MDYRHRAVTPPSPACVWHLRQGMVHRSPVSSESNAATTATVRGSCEEPKFNVQALEHGRVEACAAACVCVYVCVAVPPF